MNEKEDGAFNVNPVKKYTSPKYPTYEDVHGDLTLLKKLPSRWKKNAKVLACLGLIGTFALAGHEIFFATGHEIHHGGEGFSPVYVVYLTEQETLSIIRAEAEAAGLRLNSVPPDYTVNTSSGAIVRLNLFDEEKNVAISLIPVSWGGQRSHSSSIERVTERFAEHNKDISVSLFDTPARAADIGFGTRFIERRALRAEFTEQVREFIEALREQGILQ